jgi:rRNA maturation RNase YbeY
MADINFHIEGIRFKVPCPLKIKKWLRSAAREEGHSINEINYIFCSDKYLLQINKEYLNHNYFTDIVTFDNSEKKGVIEGDIFISIDRVRDNAKEFREEFEKELKRVMVHGLLHLVGYRDKTPAQKSKMRKREEAYLSLYPLK